MSDVRAVLFDLDGTLLDTARDLGGALNRLLRRKGKPELPFEQYRNTVSNGGSALVSLGFGTSRGESEHEQLYHELLDCYAGAIAEHTTPFDGIPELVAGLGAANIPWGVVTNKPRRFSEPLLAQVPLIPIHAVLVCPDDVIHAKPHPEPMFLAAKQLDIDAHQIVYIGDHRRDIEAAQAAGMRSIAVRYGYIEAGDSADQWGADHVVSSAAELCDIIGV